MLHCLPRLHEQQRLIEPDESRYIRVEILPGKTQGINHRVSSDLLWLEGAYSHSGYQGHVSVKNDRFVWIIVEVPDKEHPDLLLADLLDPELCHSRGVFI